MATGKEKRLPVLQAIVSTSVKAKFASCGEREANVLFISPGPIFYSPEGCLYLHGLACVFHLFLFYCSMFISDCYCEILEINQLFEHVPSQFCLYSWSCSLVVCELTAQRHIFHCLTISHLLF